MESKQWFLSDFLEDWTKAGEDLAAAMKKAQKAVNGLTTASTRVKRILAGFDQIKRLNKKTGSSKKNSKKEENAVEQQTQNLVTFQEFLDNLDVSALDLIPIKMGGLESSIRLVQQVGKVLKESWQSDLIPVGQWFSQTLIPIFGEKLGAGLQTAQTVVTGFRTCLSGVWQNVKGEAGQAAQILEQTFDGLGAPFDGLVTKMTGGSQQIAGAGGTMLESLAAAGNSWGTMLGNVQTGVETMCTGTITALQTVTEYLQGSFAKDWQAGFAGLKTPSQGAFNGVIGLMNRLLEGLGGTVNGVVDTVNKLKVKIPDWVPGLGGKQFSFSLKTVTAPQIPYLAKGAVLPANQPFLAVVGDQKHGTNVEAPLTTIQEAVAAVMADHTAGNMAGHEATVAVLNRILEAVLGMDVGEAVIARAAQNYRLKESVMKGGGF